MAIRGQQHWFQKEVRLYVSLWENDSAFYLIYYLHYEFIVSIASINSTSKKHDVLFVNYVSIWSKTTTITHGLP